MGLYASNKTTPCYLTLFFFKTISITGALGDDSSLSVAVFAGALASCVTMKRLK
jgi:hypothetical protein